MFKKIALLFVLFFVMHTSHSQSNVVNSLPCFDRTFSINFHVIKDTLFQENITNGDLQNLIVDLNAAFEPICVDFNICKTEYLNNHNFSIYEDSTMREEMRILYNDKQSINIYVVEKIIHPQGAAGFATLGGISVGDTSIVVIDKYSGSGTIIHEMGHYFGLYHTFESEEFGLEFADGSNCVTAGDLICDTPADPNGSVDANCTFLPMQDINGDYYIPKVENFMSYYPGSCTCEFSHGQYERMAATYLINPKAHW